MHKSISVSVVRHERHAEEIPELFRDCQARADRRADGPIRYLLLREANGMVFDTRPAKAADSDRYPVPGLLIEDVTFVENPFIEDSSNVAFTVWGDGEMNLVEVHQLAEVVVFEVLLPNEQL